MGASSSHNAAMSRTPGSGLIRGTCALAIACAAACAAGCGDVQPGSGTARGAHAGTAAGSAATAGAPASGPASPTPPAATGTTPATTGTAPRKRPIAPAHPVPAAFRPAAGAPSDAEVERELAQLGTVQREEHERLLSAAAANLAGLLPWADEPKSGVQVSVASVFTDYGLGL